MTVRSVENVESGTSGRPALVPPKNMRKQNSRRASWSLYLRSARACHAPRSRRAHVSEFFFLLRKCDAAGRRILVLSAFGVGSTPSFVGVVFLVCRSLQVRRRFGRALSSGDFPARMSIHNANTTPQPLSLFVLRISRNILFCMTPSH